MALRVNKILLEKGESLMQNNIEYIQELKKSIYKPILVFAIGLAFGLLDAQTFGMSMLVGLFVVSYYWGWNIIAKGHVFSGILGIWEYFTTGNIIMSLGLFLGWLAIGVYIGFFIGGYHFIKNIISYRNSLSQYTNAAYPQYRHKSKYTSNQYGSHKEYDDTNDWI